MKRIDAATLHQWLTEKKPIMLIDVRGEDEYEAASIPGAILLPLPIITRDKLPEGASTCKIVVHCRSGYRSQLACEKLALEAGPPLDLYNLDGGILAWQALEHSLS